LREGRLMTEEAVRSAEAEAAGALGSSETAGRLLRQAREAHGVHIAALAVALKVPVGKLEALEEDRYGDLPDTVFTRALASSMCRALKVDATPVLERLPQGQRPRLATNSAGLNTSFKDNHPKTAVSLGSEGGARKLKFAALALLVGAVIVYLLPSDAIDSLRVAVDNNASVPVAPGTGVGSVAIAPEAPAPVMAAPATPAAEAALPVAQALMPAVSETASAPASVAPAVVSPPPTPVEAKPVVAAMGEGVLEFRATAESWVQVRDASGAVTFQRSLAAGEAAMAPGRPPLSVVVGKVNATQVFVRGAPFDLAAVARENVARFEVK
jgi:cytoskeleton protein RodZ